MLKPTLIAIGLAAIAMPAAAADIDCGKATLVKSTVVPLEVCIDPASWQTGETQGSQEFVYFARNGRAGFAIITEKASVAMGAYRDAILAAAGQAAGSSASAVPTGEGSGDINGKPWRSMHYDVTVQGTAFEYLNYYYSEDGLGSAQFIFWSLPADALMVSTDFAGRVMPTVTTTR